MINKVNSHQTVGWVKRQRNPTDTYGFHLMFGNIYILLGFPSSTQPTPLKE
ncbi:MAG: hypothetical protein F6K48_19045 [Okeania sp. SIO3H1]|uniref:hypothetical protein n=1 Tax=Okeania sp. SIO1I7 TaxID=2607772 RepID=UPI0013C88AF7|nr:hypothetical protein [Okeania sp. SIO1I7]NEN90893.1 hypothetical protein [Okeania sp. SIO3H1]NET29151.1 hypothetical protein [Okeania sp. SIO1I7]